jgi:hypothetical protein
MGRRPPASTSHIRLPAVLIRPQQIFLLAGIARVAVIIALNVLILFQQFTA